MANLYVNLPVPATDGIGAAVDVTALGVDKTIVCAGDADASFNVEVNNDAGQAGSWSPVATFNNPGSLVVSVACMWMRVRVSKTNPHVVGAMVVDVGASDDGCQFASLTVPAGNGVGAPVNTSSLGPFKTAQVGGAFRGSLIVEISEDGATEWAQPFAFANPGVKSLLLTAKFMRVRRSGVPLVNPGTPLCNIGAGNSSSGGGGGGGGNPQRFFYIATGAEGDSFDIPLPAARPNTAYVAQVTGAGLAFQLTFDVPAISYTTTHIHVDSSGDLTAGDVLAVVVADVT